MKFNIKFIGLALTIIGIISLSVLIYDHETTKFETLSIKIDKMLVTLPECDYSYEKFIQIEEILHNAQTKLLIENNYDDSLSLVNLATAKLFSCKQESAIISSYVLIFPILILMISFGLILFLKNPTK